VVAVKLNKVDRDVGLWWDAVNSILSMQLA